jgi:hypothetical protein
MPRLSQQPGTGERVAERVARRRAAWARRIETVSTGTWLVLLLAGGLVVALLVGLFVSAGSPAVAAQLRALPAGATPRSLPVTYVVTKPTRTDVACDVEAVGVGHDVVGTLSDRLPAAAGRSVQRTVVVPTSALGVSATIVCRITARH